MLTATSKTVLAHMWPRLAIGWPRVDASSPWRVWWPTPPPGPLLFCCPLSQGEPTAPALLCSQREPGQSGEKALLHSGAVHPGLAWPFKQAGYSRVGGSRAAPRARATGPSASFPASATLALAAGAGSAEGRGSCTARDAWALGRSVESWGSTSSALIAGSDARKHDNMQRWEILLRFLPMDQVTGLAPKFRAHACAHSPTASASMCSRVLDGAA